MLSKERIRVIYWCSFAAALGCFALSSTNLAVVYPAIQKARNPPSKPQTIYVQLPAAEPPAPIVKVKTIDLTSREKCEEKVQLGLQIAKNLCDQKDFNGAKSVVTLLVEQLKLSGEDLGTVPLSSSCIPKENDVVAVTPPETLETSSPKVPEVPSHNKAKNKAIIPYETCGYHFFANSFIMPDEPGATKKQHK